MTLPVLLNQYQIVIQSFRTIIKAWIKGSITWLLTLKYFPMSKFNHFLGIDVSKEYFDAVVILNGDKNSTVHNQFTNDNKGLKQLFHWLKTNKSNAENTLACLEHTGLYGKTIIQNLLAKEFKVWVEMSLKSFVV